METFYVQDTSYFWAPSKNNSDKFVDLDGNTCEVSDIWEEIVKAAKSFHVISVSYDNMQTPESKSFFRKHGLPLRTLSFANKLKSVYYGVVKNAIHEKKIACCCDDHRLRNELLNLKVKYTERGPKIFPNPNGVVKTMDVSDCLAGACYLSTEKTCRRITRGSLMSGGPGIVGGMNVNNVAGQSIFMRELPNIRSYNGG
jgi:hypothetical protein